jgi:hypothetical protein
MKIDGACHCGYITIEGEADPEKTQICHCTDCQTGTGSAFRVSVPVPGASFRMSGQPTSYIKTTADSGNPRVQAFCPRCGSPIYSTRTGSARRRPGSPDLAPFTRTRSRPDAAKRRCAPHNGPATLGVRKC